MVVDTFAEQRTKDVTNMAIVSWRDWPQSSVAQKNYKSTYQLTRSVASLLHPSQEMEENEEEDLRKLDKMFAEIDGDGILA